MTFKQIVDMTLARIDEDVSSIEPNALIAIRNGINQGYMLLASTVDPRTKEATMPFSEKITLPTGLIALAEVKHSTYGLLDETDYLRAANLLILKSTDIKDGSLTLTYVAFPKPLSEDSDIIEISDGYVYALVSYGAYVYQIFRKKYGAAQLLLNEFMAMTGQTGQPVREGNEE